jgi:pyruvate/2-oxoglutarate dehydrogenase complex dihydrolipoamide dehydrogenase (E3) component
MSDTVDVIVIGLGVGGELVAEKLAEAGLSVVGVERTLVGGECPYWGCVPSKMMIRAANALAEARRVPGLAGTATVTPDWSPVARRIRKEATDNWDDRVAVERFEEAGGRFIRGTGRLVGATQVSVDGTTLTARRGVVIAVGTTAAIPPIPGLSDVPYWTNREAIEVETLPESLVVLGGGAIGLELAQVFRRFGVAVSVVEAADRLLALEEPEAGVELARVLGTEGVDIQVSTRAQRVRRDGEQIVVETAAGGTITGQRLLVATGRRVDIGGLGLDTVGLDASARAITVDEHMSAAPGVWAVGDCTGSGAFTHIAVYQARIAVAAILGRDHPRAEYGALSRVTFTDPEVGAVGITEAQARERGVRVRTGVAKLASSARGWIHGPGNDGFIKLVEDADRGVLVGATAMAPSGGEVLGLLALAVHAQVPVSTLRTMIYAYPTFHRGIEDALTALESGA